MRISWSIGSEKSIGHVPRWESNPRLPVCKASTHPLVQALRSTATRIRKSIFLLWNASILSLFVPSCAKTLELELRSLFPRTFLTVYLYSQCMRIINFGMQFALLNLILENYFSYLTGDSKGVPKAIMASILY